MQRLSKSRFVAGRQCHKLLWWKVHEPNARELQPDIVLQDRFDQGAQVGALAREQFPGGVLIDLPHNAVAERVEATRRAMDSGATAIYEATFFADNVYSAVDILLRDRQPERSDRQPERSHSHPERSDRHPERSDRHPERSDRQPERSHSHPERSHSHPERSHSHPERSEGSAPLWRLIEVKSSKSQKDEHVVDAAVQLYAVERSGVRVSAVEIMHLSGDCHHPDLSNLFVRTDVTEAARALLPAIPAEVEAMRTMLAGALPSVPIGLQCSEPYDCAFQERCWPTDDDHISRLYSVGRGKRCSDYMATGVHRIGDIPPKKKLSDTARRQIRAMQENRTIVEDGLAEALKPFNCRLGFLDFETIQRAVPVWPGMAPWDQEPAQFSYHEFDYTRSALTPEDESRGHAEFLAEGPVDCRPALAERMIAATKNAERVVSFSPFEGVRIRGLQESVPDLRNELVELEHKLIDLLPVLRNHVYHPKFHGSFSLKVVLPAMVPDVSYEGLVIFDGMVASVEIARLLFVAGKVTPGEHERVRAQLLAYCKRDTWAMVKLLSQLRHLARS